MTLRKLIGTAALVSALPLLALTGIGPARAQSSCAGSVGVTATIEVDEPAPNAVVSGPTLFVSGIARTELGVLSRVEATFEGSPRSEVYPPAQEVGFAFAFNLGRVPPGDAVVHIVACGPGLTGALIGGERRIVVTVGEPVTRTTAAAPTTIVQAAGDTSAATTTVPVSTTIAAAAATTSTSSLPAETATEQAREVTPRAGLEAPLILTDAPEDDSPQKPLWVGAVVGISGGLGLLFSAASSRRRGRTPEAAEPVDPDLLEVN
ncbi:MAG: hypothetical protein ABR540_15660 [Acidimicrobiales bacterium]|nr:hypothetical protein [Actinomycetota bacterium]